MTHVTCRLTAKNRDQLRNPTLGNRIWATFTFLVINCFGRLFCAPRLLRPGAPAPSCSPVSHATDDYNRQHNNKGRHRIWLSMLAAFRTSVRKQKHANSKLINNKTTCPPLRCTSYDPVSVCVQVGVLPKCLNGRAGLWHGCFLRHILHFM